MTDLQGVVHIREFIKKHKLAVILLAAVLTVLSLAMVAQLSGKPKDIIIEEQGGMYDLTDIKSSKVSVIRLVPGKTYYPNTYLLMENANTTVSDSIEQFEEIRADYLSQNFVLLLPDNSDTYKFTFKLSGRHAMRVYVNGILAAQTGHPGTAKQDTEIWENNITFYASPSKGKMDIILHSAQFYHAKRGASLAELNLSKPGSGIEAITSGRIKGLLVTGAFLSAAISLLSIYLMLSRTSATLYFALACIVMALRECLQSQAWVYFPIPGNLSFLLEYLSMVLLTIFLTLYLTQYVTGKFLCVVQYTAIIGSCIFGACVLFGDSLFYTSVLKYYQFLLVICIVPGIAVLFYKLRSSTMEQDVAIYGIAVFFLAALSDIMMYSDIFRNQQNAPITEAAMLFFVLAQTASLFQMNSRILSESREAEHKLEAEKLALESLNRLKTEFLSNVSHELKTPLTVVSGHAQLIETQLTQSNYAAIREKSRIISSEADRLALMVGQMLDVTRIEEKKMLLEKKPCHIDELIYKAVETHFSILNKGENQLDIDVGLELPQINVDPARITQVLVNLIANALRHTRQGVITVSARKCVGFIEISVSDTGKGIPPEELENLFTRFRPGDGETGTGLGLYICKYLVEEHDGKILVESTVNKGTTISFTLPL